MADYLLDNIVQGEKNQSLMGIFCGSCHICFSTDAEHKTHYKSDFHQFNLKRQMHQLAPISEAVFEKSLNEIMERSKEQHRKNKLEEKKNCESCWKEFKSNQTYVEHLKSKKHSDNLKINRPKPESKKVEQTTKENINICLFCNVLSESFEKFIKKKFIAYE